jgi:alpha-glucosidase (family GH31 glycosyl hydrolase)
MNRRELLRTAGAAMLLPAAHAQDSEIRLTAISPYTVRITIGTPPDDGALVDTHWPAPAATLAGISHPRSVRCGGFTVELAPPLSFTFKNGSETVQTIAVSDTGVISFRTGDAPLFGLGEGGPQFDLRGSTDTMRNGQAGPRLRTFGGRVPIPWVIGTGGWALFFHQSLGAFDFTGPESKLTPARAGQPLDVFLVASRDPAVIMGEYARLTGFPELPALWTLGYQQSHRTLAGREEVLQEAKTFREKKLPCDALIYLGTGFCPSGWNTNNGEFTFNQKVFPDPKAIFDQLHRDNFKVVLHVAYPTGIHEMKGTVADPCDSSRRAETQPSCYWNMHKPVWELGVDGWWPDEGDALDGPSRLVRNRMYWDAPRLDRPNERPYALHRNGYPGMQRYASFLWSGDVNSQWETLRNHIPIAVNTGLSGIPLWGTDIGGFVPTSELTAELYVRWFQFGAFCPLFRSHGRTWKLRLPWGWDTGDPGPLETPNYRPDPAELHDARVEPICRKYLDLRYRLMPYLYSVVREGTRTGMPIVRALWLHYPDDPAAVARGDEYLWGRDMLIAPVVEKGATERKLYLPRGAWHDFWTSERIEGGREVARKVDLETTPIYVRAGAVLPMGPVKQYTGEKVDGPLTLAVYPGANGSFLLYEDAGNGFEYRKGEWTGTQIAWNDARRTLSLRLAPGSRMVAPRDIEVTVGGAKRTVKFIGKPVEVKFS